MLTFFMMTVGVLAAVSIPAYQDYTIRSKVTTSINLAAAPAQRVVQQEYQLTKRMPKHVLLPALSNEARQYVQAIDYNSEQEELQIVFGFSPLANKTLHLRAMPSDYGITWQCFSSDIIPRYLPVSCR